MSLNDILVCFKHFGLKYILIIEPQVFGEYHGFLSEFSTSGWEANVSLRSIPVGETVIKAWVYDEKRQQFIQLNGEPKIKVLE